MEISTAKEIHALITSDDWSGAGNKVLSLLGKPPTVQTKSQAIPVLRSLFNFLLESDDYLSAATLQWGPDVFNAEPESVRRSFEAIHKNSKLLVMGGSSLGKCLHPDTMVLMFDGTSKMAKDVKVGDKLMGDDSKERNVITTSQGRSEMFKITPERGDAWICNDAHILSLRMASTKICGNSGKAGKKRFRGRIIDIPIKEYLCLPKSNRSNLKQFHVGVEFQSQSIPFDPYVYGSWIGDGGTDVPALHTPRGKMSERWCEYFISLGYRIHVGYEWDSCQMFCARMDGKSGEKRNPFLNFIRTSVIQPKKEKFIRDEYLRNSRGNRMKLLAGLIDSDGWVSCNTSYGFVSKFKNLAEQVKWLARSLGFAAVVSPKKYGIKSIGFESIYWHVQISGKGISDIPTLEKHAKESTSFKELTNTGFSVESIGIGDYCGFVIDGNHRFLLGDFTVTHNTYGIGAWMFLDYLRDPYYTSVKLAAISEKHLKENLFPHVVKLWRNLAIPSGYDIMVKESDLWLGIKEAGLEFGVSGIAFKQSQETSGQFKGYKFMPVRKKPHPKFGVFSRLRVLCDEAQNFPGGPFQDFNSLMASMDDTGRIKLCFAFNPENISCHVVDMAEPEQGWNLEDMDTLYDYDSKKGWRVCRLDAAKCENIIQRREVYPGLQTYRGFMDYLKSGGDASAAYSCFARGFPPIKGNINTIIQPSWPQEARGEATFIEKPIIVGAADLAFMGSDSAQLVVGRWGKASVWRNETNQYQAFKDRLNVAIDKPRYVLQIDQMLPLSKHDDASTMAEEIMGRCQMLGIKPENLAVDKTGIGFGTYSHLSKVWGTVYGIGWSEGATVAKILEDDKEGADSHCDGVMSEMWWAFRRWLEPQCRAILINPIIPPQPIHTQLTARRYKTGKRGIKVESKEEYKARNRTSPDEADALVMLVHLIRHISPILPGLAGDSMPQQHGRRTEIDFRPIKRMISIDEDDSISLDGKEKELVGVE